jgi:hypothetical protein
MRIPFLLALPALLGGALLAQSNTVPGLASRLSDLTAPQSFGRIGTYPTGRSGFATGVTVCNAGSVVINWLAPMNADHPTYGFMMCRESGGRFVQISDWSYVKHGFASINSNCGGCILPPGGGSQLGINCGDTYGAGLNADRYWLGPPSEIDPWLLTWNPVGSHFDRGEPDVGPPQNTDGIRSLTTTQTNAMDGVKHRLEVDDADMNVPGATFVLAGRVMTRGEAEATREDNMLSRRMNSTWGGVQWMFSNIGPMVPGSPLVQWTGSVLRSGKNGNDDGRVYVATRVTGLGNGRWRYEYALHNRDNSRGIAGFHVPKCSSARIFAAGFRDIDKNSFNDWTVQVSGSEVAFLAGAGNAMEWNTIYNCWFESDAAPAGGTTTLDQARPGPGALQFAVLDVQAPLHVGNRYLGDGCGSAAPTLHATGNPALPTIPNPTFGLRTVASPGALVLLAWSPQAASQPLGGCTVYVDQATVQSVLGVAGPGGTVDFTAAIPASASLEGNDVAFQAAELRIGGALSGQADLSNGLQVRVGNLRSGCP